MAVCDRNITDSPVMTVLCSRVLSAITYINRSSNLSVHSSVLYF